MSEKHLGEALKERISAAVKEANVASAVNVGETGSHTTVKSTRRVIQKDGVTTVTEETEEGSS
jgi:hypothetical protein